MLVQYSYAQNYLFTALSVAPDLYDYLLTGLTSEEADHRPDPDRFTIREIMAHLADWEQVFLNRMTRICTEDIPLLEGYDEGEWAIEHNYAATEPFEQARLFRERRAKLVAFLRDRSAADWDRTGNRPEIGLVTLEALSLLIPLHDMYHLNQIVAWRQR
jgi:uncharacterized damage-inducible protein DinB